MLLLTNIYINYEKKNDNAMANNLRKKVNNQFITKWSELRCICIEECLAFLQRHCLLASPSRVQFARKISRDV